jgi:acyl-CoA synthetase (AMP-forming)/AMP-acid ligase II
MQLHDLLLHAERTSRARPAIVDGPLRRDYGEVAARVRRAASGLGSLGLGPGRHVAIIDANTADFYEAYFALSLAGLTAVPVNTRLSPTEVAFILEDSDCAAVLVGENFGHLAGPDGSRRKIALGPAEDSGWNDLIRSSEALANPVGPQSEDAVAHIFYTGGTTGRSKGVMLSHRNVTASAMNKNVLGGFARDDVWLHAAPMYHQADAWAVFSFTSLGAMHVFMPSFVPQRALDLIEEHGVTGFQLVPTMIFMMSDQPDASTRNLSRVRRILYGSAPMPTEKLRRAVSAFGDVFQHIYGLTEAAGTVAATPWPPAADEREGARMASCGQPIIGIDMRIADEAGRQLPPDRTGRIQVRGATVMQGYWNREEETKTAFVDGWLDTGDLGRMDEGGFVYIVDRAKDMIISGGENVYSAEVEDVIYAHPDIAEAAVIGLPDPKWGEAVTAVVTLRPGAHVTPAALIAHCRESLAGYKCPKSVQFVEVMPKSAAGKILKHLLRKTADGDTVSES